MSSRRTFGCVGDGVVSLSVSEHAVELSLLVHLGLLGLSLSDHLLALNLREAHDPECTTQPDETAAGQLPGDLSAASCRANAGLKQPWQLSLWVACAYLSLSCSSLNLPSSGYGFTVEADGPSSSDSRSIASSCSGSPSESDPERDLRWAPTRTGSASALLRLIWCHVWTEDGARVGTLAHGLTVWDACAWTTASSQTGHRREREAPRTSRQSSW